MKWVKVPKGVIGVSNGEIKFAINKKSGMPIHNQNVDDIGPCILYMYEVDYDERDEPVVVKEFDTQKEATDMAFFLDRERKMKFLKDIFGIE